MPFCDACARHWTPTSMRADGSCPDCGRVLERPPSRRPTVVAEDPPDEGATEPPKAPWHFKVMLVALFLYLAWRGVQGLGWIASQL